MIFCGADCTQPSDQSALVQPTLFPSASNGYQSYLVPGTGHGINAHYSAPQAFQQIQKFVVSNGF